MIDQKNKKELKRILTQRLGKGTKSFIFGSALDSKSFSDIDIAIQHLELPDVIYQIKEDMENSQIPYKVDIVDFDRADTKFQKKVLKQKIEWLT